MTQKIRLGVFTLHPISYQVGIWQQLGRDATLDVTVHFLSDFACFHYKPDHSKSFETWHNEMNPIVRLEDFEGYKLHFSKNLRGSNFSNAGFLRRVNFDILPLLWRREYDCILLHGYDTISAWMILVIAKLCGIKVIWRGEAVIPIANKSTIRNFLKQTIKRLVIRVVFKLSDIVLYSCQGNKKFQRHYGVNRNKQKYFHCSIDNREILRQREHFKGGVLTVKQQLNIGSDKLVVVMLGRLAPIKDPMALLEAVNLLEQKSQIAVLLVGSGSLERQLQDYAQQNQIQLHTSGFIAPKDLGRYLTIADIAVNLSYYDPSPKALNELMLYSMPVIVGDNVGTAEDLVQQGRNGFIVPYRNTKAVAEHLQFFVRNKNIIKKMGDASFHIIKQHSYAVNAQTISTVAQQLCKK